VELGAKLTDSITTGSEAVLRFSVQWQTSRSQEVLVWMRFEDGEWRIRELDAGMFGGRHRFDGEEFVERFRNRQQKQNESEATSTLFTWSYGLQRYSETHPDVGFPEELSLLAAPETSSSDEEEAVSFLSAEMARNDLENGGYRFHYQLLHGGPQGAYHITARPIDQARSGRFSYFMDESGNVHQTSEDREATADDPLIGGGDDLRVVE
jgi:hypothetical protein